ncbi:zinc ribbon domain-containing protein [Sphingomonas cannabina]|uniref:FmdB family zinc ribbon protein n=1 Tax=Sphingomonas cannabina TaxID=2899123 RepID=UPI001F43EC1B|nr:zinc ribbon domain-containing protein [Sphingomonas cannabina]UIJ43788.1 zinc ribbon domain-containing protein [Sphingomonas cannabina]
MPLYDFACDSGHRFERAVPLARFDEVQACPCGSAAHRLVSAPRVISDYIEPIRGPDGKIHDSMRSYRRSLEPSGNPQGERYIEIGNEELKPQTPKFDRQQRVDDIKAAIADVKAGKPIPSPVFLED